MPGPTLGFTNRRGLDRTDDIDKKRPRAATTLGILCLDEGFPDTLVPCGVFDSVTFGYDLVHEIVEGATVERILDADATLERSFVAAARRLEKKGPDAVVSNCGFSVIYQDAVQRATSIPVALSALSLLPFLQTQLTQSGRIAIVTFDSSKLTQKHLMSAWPSFVASQCAVVGIENTTAWTRVLKNSDYHWPQIGADLMTAAQEAASSSNVELILLECAAFIDFTDQIRDRFGKPVFDLVSLSNVLMRSI